MLFLSRLRHRQRGARRTQTRGLRRTRPLRLYLEILEGRLAPGDVVLGNLLASVFTGPSPVDWDSLSASPESSPDAGLWANHLPFHPCVWSGLEDDQIGLAPALAPSPSPSEQPGTLQGGSAAAAPTAFFVDNSRGALPAGSPRSLLGVDDLFASPFADPLHPPGGLGAAPNGAAPRGSPRGAEGLSAGGGGRGLASGNGSGPVSAVAAGLGAAGAFGVAQPLTAAAEGVPSAAPPTPLLPPAANPQGLTDAGPGGADAPGPRRHAVHAGFDLTDPTGGPFPSDRFTVRDASNLTRLRVSLPMPDPATNPSDYQDAQVLNTLDGFNLQPRLSIPFDGPIDVNSVNSRGVFLINLGDTVDHQEHGDHVVGINQVVWDPPSHTLPVESDQLLDQHTRYALIVTRGIQDLSGHHVQASQEFKHFVHHGQGEYHTAIVRAIEAAEEHGVPEHDVVTASVFTTQSATAVLEKIRDQIHAATPAPADFLLGPGGTRTVFALDDVTSITWNQQTHHDPNQFSPVPLTTELAALRDLIPGTVGRIAYGKYTSPEYLVHPGEFIPAVATRTGTPQVQRTQDIYFNIIVPSGPMPPSGWPVAIYGTGAEGTKDTWLLRVAASMAAQGVATVSINYYGRGFGPESTITVQRPSEGPVTFLAGGRSIDQNGDGMFGGNEGFESLAPLVSSR